MKNSQIILFLALLGYCFSDTEDICANKFEENIEKLCKSIDSSCKFSPYTDERCISTTGNTCSKGDNEDNDATVCNKLFPSTFPTQKCRFINKKCEEVSTECSDYNHFINNNILSSLSLSEKRELCKQFSSGSSNKECRLDNSGNCNSYYNNCEGLNNDQCNANLFPSYVETCEWSDNSCHKIPRKCTSPIYNINEDECHNLKPTSTATQACVYSDGICQQEYISCESIPLAEINTFTCSKYPLILKDNYYIYDYNNICDYIPPDGTVNQKCQKKAIYCDYFNTHETDPLICIQFKAKDENKRCVYGSDPDTHSSHCYEEYKSCETFTDTKIETKRERCENINLLEEDEECIYNTEKDECLTKSKTLTYQECDAYKENSKKICESIVLYPTSRQYCILDKDTNCIERPLFCSEAIDREECLNIAKAKDENKRCAYGTNGCYEEYIRCEDFIENNKGSGSKSCSDINLYNGMKCKYEQVDKNTDTYRCRTNYKTCEGEGLEIMEDECKLIAKTGVSDPERKICDYIKHTETESYDSERCIENYKYCSDYRGSKGDVCKQIKPYNEEGDKIEIGFKCKIEDVNTGCQRIPVECGDAKNPIECKLFSDYIKDHEKKYCTYYDGDCKEYYKKCEDVEDLSKCTSNIMEGYLLGLCKIDGDKCITKRDCHLFKTLSSSSQYYKEICESINPNCTYSSSECTYVEKKCKDTKFYPEFENDDDEKKKEYCENMQASERYKKCVLKEDKSGCDEVYRELSFSSSYYSNTNPPDSEPKESSSYFIEKGINFISLLIGLLF